MIFGVKSATALVAGGSVVGGSYYFYDSVRPKTVKSLLRWEGYNLANSENIFRAKFIDNKDDIKTEIPEANISVSFNDEKIKENGKKLQAWCEEQYEKPYTFAEEIKERLIKYCKDEVETVKGFLVAKGEENLISNYYPDYKVVFAVYKYNSTFYKDLNVTDAQFKDNEAGTLSLKNWCEEKYKKLVKYSNSEEIKQVSWWCSKLPYSTIEQKIKHDDPTWEIEEDGKEEKWKGIFDKWRKTSKFIVAINKSIRPDPNLTYDSDLDKGHKPLSEWCKTALKRNLYDLDAYIDEYQHVKAACRKDNAPAIENKKAEQRISTSK